MLQILIIFILGAVVGGAVVLLLSQKRLRRYVGAVFDYCY